MNKKFIVFTILITLIKYSYAFIPAQVDRNNPGLGQSFTLNISLPNANAHPQLDKLSQDFTIYNTSMSSETNIINGHTTTQNNLIITLIPKKSGKQTIPAITIGNDSTQPIVIDVGASSSTNSTNSSIYAKGLITNQSNAYIGVPLIYTLSLHYKNPLANVNMSPLNIPNATVSTLGKTTQYQANESGNVYQVLEQKFLITPNNSGQLIIPPIQINGEINDNDFFSLNAPKVFNVATKQLSIAVANIPAGITPDKWLPAKDLLVKESWSVTGNSIQVGQPITRSIVIQAKGVPSASIPNLDLITPSNVNAYPDKTISQDANLNSDILATKTFKIAYIPTQTGQLNFPSITFNWWNINTKSLQSITIPAKEYTVSNPTGNNIVMTQPPLNNNPITQDNSLIPSSNNLSSNKTTQPNRLWVYLTFIFACLWLITLAILIILLKYFTRNAPSNDNGPKSPNPTGSLKPNDHKKLLAQIIKACDQHDLKQVNSSLISWARLYWHKQDIYTISDIAKLTEDKSFQDIIKQINLALYCGQEFNNYEGLKQKLPLVVANQQQTKITSKLNSFYPD